MSVFVLNCPEIPGGGDCEHKGEVYVCFWGLDVCKSVLECSLSTAQVVNQGD